MNALVFNHTCHSCQGYQDNNCNKEYGEDRRYGICLLYTSVIGGEVAAVDKAAEVALELKAKRVVPLNVSGPFHTSLLEPASKKLAEKLNQVSFGNMNIPVVFNTTAKELQPDETISGLLTKQIMSSVYLEDSIRYMIDRGIDTFLEIGPGKVLSGFIKKISKDVSIYQVEDVASLTLSLIHI